MNIDDDPAVSLIRRLAADGHSALHIARALNIAGIRTNRGSGRWHDAQVSRLAKEHGISVRYSPALIRLAQERDRQRAQA